MSPPLLRKEPNFTKHFQNFPTFLQFSKHARNHVPSQAISRELFYGFKSCVESRGVDVVSHVTHFVDWRSCTHSYNQVATLTRHNYRQEVSVLRFSFFHLFCVKHQRRRPLGTLPCAYAFTVPHFYCKGTRPPACAFTALTITNSTTV